MQIYMEVECRRVQTRLWTGLKARRTLGADSRSDEEGSPELQRGAVLWEVLLEENVLTGRALRFVRDGRCWGLAIPDQNHKALD